MLGMGFDVQLKGNQLKIDDLDFIVGGQPVPTAKLQGEQQALALEQAEQQAAMQEAMMEQQAEQQATAEASGPPQEEGGISTEEGEEEGSQEVPIENAVPDTPRGLENIESKNIKNPDLRKATSTSTWIDSLFSQGYEYPIVKQISPDGQHIWFSNNGEDYTGNLSGTGVDKIAKAYFGNPVFSEAGGKKLYGDGYTSENGDGTSKNKAVDVSEDDEDD